MSGPNLSQYFANDPPSMFDEIATNTIGNGLCIIIERAVLKFKHSDNNFHFGFQLVPARMRRLLTTLPILIQTCFRIDQRFATIPLIFLFIS